MTRTIGAQDAPPLEACELFLMVGPTRNGPAEFTEAEGEAAWQAHRHEVMDDWPRRQPGFRPWGFWRFEVGEHPEGYEAEVIALAERGLLWPEEIEALADARTRTDVNDGIEHTDRAAVELHERVAALLQSR